MQIDTQTVNAIITAITFICIICLLSYIANYKKKECDHKWKYFGFYDGGYYNHKYCIYCNKTELEKSQKYNPNKNTILHAVGELGPDEEMTPEEAVKRIKEEIAKNA